MTVNEIFNTKAVRETETEILNLQYSLEKRAYRQSDCETTAIKHLLSIRKNILNDMFVLDENYKNLLIEFNEKLKKQLTDMRLRTVKLYETLKDTDEGKNMLVSGKCFLGYKYPSGHPVQTIRAKKMWAILNGSISADFMPLSSGGVCSFEIDTAVTPVNIPSLNQMLYLGDSADNWDEGLDRNFTKDMHLIYPFHNLYEHMEFSIFDLLWVRDFDVELNVNAEYSSYKDYDDNLDWSKCDYFD